MKIFAFAASNSLASINDALLTHALARLKTEILPGAEIEHVSLSDFALPIYSPQHEKQNGVPALAVEFFNRLGASDAVLISFAEHNGYATAAWKNTFDWMTRIDQPVWQGKPLVFLSATPGPRAGAGVLSGQESLAPYFGGTVLGTLGIGTWSDAWDAERQELTRETDIKALGDVLSKFASQKVV